MLRNSIGGTLALLWLSAAPIAAQEIYPVTPLAECSAELALIRTDDDRALGFAVEIADTPEARAQGLMFRRSLPAGTGMLFIYEQPQRVSFWMQNTLIPLDMIFVDASGEIRHIHPNARPLDETSIPGAAAGDPSPERLMVLEIAGGEAARLGLQPGQVLAHPGLDEKQAAWPCREGFSPPN